MTHWLIVAGIAAVGVLGAWGLLWLAGFVAAWFADGDVGPGDDE